MANPRIINLNPDFMCPWWSNLDILDAEVLAGFPGNCCLYAVSTHPLFISALSSLRRCLRIRMPSPTCECRHRVEARNSCAFDLYECRSKRRRTYFAGNSLHNHVSSRPFLLIFFSSSSLLEQTYLSNSVCGHDSDLILFQYVLKCRVYRRLSNRDERGNTSYSRESSGSGSFYSANVGYPPTTQRHHQCTMPLHAPHFGGRCSVSFAPRSRSKAQARGLLGDALITGFIDVAVRDWSGCLCGRGMLARKGDFGSRAADLVTGLG
jgi:hypothetical protein